MTHNLVKGAGQKPLNSEVRHPPQHATGCIGGTILLTEDGEIPVEYVAVGDRIITRDAGFVRVDHISISQQNVRAIWFAAGSLGDTRPELDLTLPENQLVLVRDWRAKAVHGKKQAMVRAADLVDNEFVRDLGHRPMTLYQMHFSAPHVVYAGGLELASLSPEPMDLRPAA